MFLLISQRHPTLIKDRNKKKKKNAEKEEKQNNISLFGFSRIKARFPLRARLNQTKRLESDFVSFLFMQERTFLLNEWTVKGSRQAVAKRSTSRSLTTL